MPQRCLKRFDMKAKIVSYCKIKNNTVWVNGEKFYVDNQSVDITTFLAHLYKQLNLNYPKFFKMDNLCKLGILATELAIQNNSEFNNYEKDKVAISLSNNSSSIETDRNHIKTIADKNQYFPSPSLFVYTLPNIIIGEIAIKYKLTGENSFFISEKFDENLMCTYDSILLNEAQSSHTTAVIGGWVNVDGNEGEGFIYCLEKANFNPDRTGFSSSYNSETIHKFYNKTE